MVALVGDELELHQSDLSTFNRCGERFRLSLLRPDLFGPSNDAAVRGTGMHHAIALVLEGKLDPAEAPEAAHAEVLRIINTEPVKMIQDELPTVVAEKSAKLTAAWMRHILPTVELGGLVETKFRLPLPMKANGLQVVLAGQVDYIPPSRGPDIYDWKTAGRKYYQREKQRTDIQPTVYSYALTHGAFGEPVAPPITFRYGVAVMVNGTVTTQLIDVQRTADHEAWLLDLIESFLNLMQGVGVERTWPRDEEQYLCSKVWCPGWDLCKGARLTPAEDLWTA